MSQVRSSRASGRITLQDVAREAGVSPITASRALRGTRGVSPDLVARTAAAADKLGYVPDPAARALASSRSAQVAVLIPLLSNTLFVDVLDAVQRALLPAGFQTLIGVTHYDSAEEEQLLRSFLPHRPSGLLLTGFDRTESARRLIQDSGIPTVHLMEVTSAPGIYSVGFSQTEAGRAITEHLLEQGHRRIAYAAAQLDPRVLQRAEGYRQALRAYGCYDPALELLSPASSSIELGGRLLQEALTRHPDIDAIFFCNDDLGQGALLKALELGIAVPSRLAVVGFNDLPGSPQMLPPLTSVRTKRREMGLEAANMMLSLMRGESPAQPNVDLGFELVLRGSG